MRPCGWIRQSVRVWHLLRRPFITVCAHNHRGAAANLLQCESACAKLCTYFYMQTYPRLRFCLRSLYVRVLPALLFNERKWLEKNSDQYISTEHEAFAQRSAIIRERDLWSQTETERQRWKENMWAADETEKMRQGADGERWREEAMDDSFNLFITVVLRLLF